jgi:hypothetical protein
VNKEHINQRIRQFNNDIAKEKRNIFRDKFVISFITLFIIMIAIIIIILHFVGYVPAVEWNNSCAETKCIITNNSVSLYGNKYKCYIDAECNDTLIYGVYSFSAFDQLFKSKTTAEYYINKDYPINNKIKLFYDKNNLNDIRLTKKSPTAIMTIEIILGVIDTFIIILACVSVIHAFKWIHQRIKVTNYIEII